MLSIEYFEHVIIALLSNNFFSLTNTSLHKFKSNFCKIFLSFFEYISYPNFLISLSFLSMSIKNITNSSVS